MLAVESVKIEDELHLKDNADQTRTKEFKELFNSLSNSNYFPNTSASESLLKYDNRTYPHFILNISILHSAKAHDKDINTIAISPNDVLAATGSTDKSIKLWNTDNLSLIATLSGHKRSVWKVLFSVTDKVLVSSSGDRSVKIWSVNDYSCLVSFSMHIYKFLVLYFVNCPIHIYYYIEDI